VIFVNLFNFAAYVGDLFGAVCDICEHVDYEVDMDPLEVPPNLNATFEVPDKVTAVAHHTTRFQQQ